MDRFYLRQRKSLRSKYIVIHPPPNPQTTICNKQFSFWNDTNIYIFWNKFIDALFFLYPLPPFLCTICCPVSVALNMCLVHHQSNSPLTLVATELQSKGECSLIFFLDSYLSSKQESYNWIPQKLVTLTFST